MNGCQEKKSVQNVALIVTLLIGIRKDAHLKRWRNLSMVNKHFVPSGRIYHKKAEKGSPWYSVEASDSEMRDLCKSVSDLIIQSNIRKNEQNK